jgi:purine-binding chemotaxis protein CheW
MSAQRDSAPAQERVELCTFRIAGEDYAVDLKRVREIINPLPVTPVPRAPAFIEGVIRLRTEVIPVVDVRKRFGAPPAPPTRRTKFIVVRIGGRRLALVVDEVTEVVRLQRSEIRAAPNFAEGEAPRFFLGVCGGEEGARAADGQGGGGRRGSGRLRLLLNVRALLEAERPGEAAAARAQAEAVKDA